MNDFPADYDRAIRYSAANDPVHDLMAAAEPHDLTPSHTLTPRRAALSDALREAGRDDEADILADPSHHAVVETRTGRDLTSRPHKIRHFNWRDFDGMTQSYADAALWSSHDYDEDGNGGEALDANYGLDDIHHRTAAEMAADVEGFRDSLPDDLRDIVDQDPDRAGHYFWLSRNGHGANFRDGPFDRGHELHRHAKTFGGYDLYVGDDGKIHGS